MAFQFPASPVVGQTYTPSAGITFKWNGTAWYLVNSTLLTPTEADTRYVQIANARSMESRIINGNFAIDQRNAGAVVTVTGSQFLYAVDRWRVTAVGAGAIQGRRESKPGAAALSALSATVGTTATPPSGDHYLITHLIEGIHTADLQFGTAQAQPFTLAFNVQCSVAGTFPISFGNAAFNRSYVKTFAVAANTMTPVTVTIPGDTTGVWERGNLTGLIVTIGLGVGPTYQGSAADSWLAGGFLTIAGCTNMMATAGAKMYVSDARLYPGTIDYGPCQRLYADELRLCQRYYQKSYDQHIVPGSTLAGGVQMVSVHSVNTGGNAIVVRFAAVMRAPPTATLYSDVTGTPGGWWRSGASGDVAMATLPPGESGIVIYNNGPVGVGEQLKGHWTVSAEL